MNTLEYYNKCPEDVVIVMIPAWNEEDEGITATWTEFAELAKDVNYYRGFGLSEVKARLTILFRDNTWLARWEDGGSEGWEYHSPPTIPTGTRPMKQDDLLSEWGVEKDLERKTFLAGGTMELDWESSRRYLGWMFPENGVDPWWISWQAEKQTNKIDDESLRGPQLVRGIWK